MLPTLLALALGAAMPAPFAVPAAAALDATLLPCTVTPHDTLIGLNRTLLASPGAWKDVARIDRLPDSNRLEPGEVPMVPARYLHSQVVSAQLLSVFGDVRIRDKPGVAGAAFDVETRCAPANRAPPSCSSPTSRA